MGSMIFLSLIIFNTHSLLSLEFIPKHKNNNFITPNNHNKFIKSLVIQDEPAKNRPLIPGRLIPKTRHLTRHLILQHSITINKAYQKAHIKIKITNLRYNNKSKSFHRIEWRDWEVQAKKKNYEGNTCALIW